MSTLPPMTELMKVLRDVDDDGLALEITAAARSYAEQYAAAVLAEYKAGLNPVAWAVTSPLGTIWNTTHEIGEAGGWQRASHGGLTRVLPLYLLD